MSLRDVRIESDVASIANSLETLASTPGFGAIHATYTFSVNFDTAASQKLKGHPTLRGKVMDIAVLNVSEALDGSTETVSVGVTGDTDKFGITAALGTAAIGASLHPALTEGETIPAGTDILVTNTTAGSTGIADVAVTIAWFV